MTATKVARNEIKTGVGFPKLTHADRSDAYASGAVQALVRVEKGGKDLLFDGHSYAKHEPALITSGWTVVEDNREQAQNLPTAAY